MEQKKGEILSYAIHAHGLQRPNKKCVILVPCNCIVFMLCEPEALEVDDDLEHDLFWFSCHLGHKAIKTSSLNDTSRKNVIKEVLGVLNGSMEKCDERCDHRDSGCSTMNSRKRRFCAFGPGQLVPNISFSFETTSDFPFPTGVFQLPMIDIAKETNSHLITCNKDMLYEHLKGNFRTLDTRLQQFTESPVVLDNIINSLCIDSKAQNKLQKELHLIYVFACRCFSCTETNQPKMNTIKLISEGSYLLQNHKIEELGELIDNYDMKHIDNCYKDGHLYLTKNGVVDYVVDEPSPKRAKTSSYGGGRLYKARIDVQGKYIMSKKKKWYLADHRGQYRYSRDREFVMVSSNFFRSSGKRSD